LVCFDAQVSLGKTALNIRDALGRPSGLVPLQLAQDVRMSSFFSRRQLAHSSTIPYWHIVTRRPDFVTTRHYFVMRAYLRRNLVLFDAGRIE
jgi:hypothetical protein